MYYHREVCIDNVYICVKEPDEGGMREYGDAMLKFTKLTKGSHKEYVAPCSPHLYAMVSFTPRVDLVH